MLTRTLAATLAVVCLAASSARADDAASLPVDQLKWVELFGPGSPQEAVAWGDKKTGPVGFYLKLPDGFTSLWHTHTGEYQGVVVKGTLVNKFQGKPDSPALPAGSYYSIPAKVNHVNVCSAGSECIIYIHMKSGTSFIPLTPEGKPLPAQAPAKPAAK